MNDLHDTFKIAKAVGKVVLVMIGIATLFDSSFTFTNDEFSKATHLLLLSWLMFWLAYQD